MSKVPKSSKFRAAQVVKMAFLELQNDQIWFYVKSERQKNPEISTTCITN